MMLITTMMVMMMMTIPSTYLVIFLSALSHPSIHPSIHTYIHKQPTHPFIHQHIHPYIHLSIPFRSTCTSIHRSPIHRHLSIHSLIIPSSSIYSLTHHTIVIYLFTHSSYHRHYLFTHSYCMCRGMTSNMTAVAVPIAVTIFTTDLLMSMKTAQ